jgi:anti-sigma factor RsiW
MTALNDERETADPAERLAARLAARDLLVQLAAAEAPAPAAISNAELWAYAHREPGSAVSFAVERLLRTDPAIQARYRRMLMMRSLDHSERAAAAYSGGLFRRQLKDCTIQIVEEDGAPPTLLITLEAGRAAPRWIEVVALEGMVRQALPEALDGYIVLELPRGDEERDQLRILLANPAAGVYLI